MRPLSRSASLLLLLVIALLLAGGATVAAKLAGPDRDGEAAAPASHPAGGKHADPRQFATDRVLVGFKRGASGDDQDVVLEAVDAEPLKRVGRVAIVELPEGTDAEQAAAKLADDPDVAFAEPDLYRRLDACDDCWQLGEAPGINAVAAHREGRTGEGSVVAVLDSGVAEIDDLAGKVLGSRVCRDDGTCDEDKSVTSSHGTIVASLIAARDDDKGGTGVAPGASIKSWRVEQDGVIATSAVLAALAEVAEDPEIDVVNLSFSGPMPSTAERLAIQTLLDQGKSVVASAGNDGSYLPRYPAAYRGVLSVGAGDDRGGIAGFSSYGKVDVVAPGVCVLASAPDGAKGSAGCPEAGGGAVRVNGTSFAAPLVSGMLALGASGSALRDRLGVEGTAAPVDGEAVEAKRAGHGLADAGAWLASLAPDAPPYLVLEATDQLPHPSTTIEAFVLTSDGLLAEAPSGLKVSGIAETTAPFEEVAEGVFRASLASGNLAPGSLLVTATAEAPPARRAPPPPPPPPSEPPPSTTAPAPTTTVPPEPTSPPPTTSPTTTTGPGPTTTEPATTQPATTASEPTSPPSTTAEAAPTTTAPSTTTSAPTTTAPPPSAGVGDTGGADGTGPKAAATGPEAAADDTPVKVAGSVAVRALRPDDQAPGVTLLGTGLNPGQRADSLQGGGAGEPANDDLDDVFRVRLEEGDTIRIALTPQAGQPIGAVLFSPGTTDVFGELDRIVAASGPVGPDGAAILTYQAQSGGNYLVDVYTNGLESGTPGKGTYQLTTTITRPDVLRVDQPVCSPNGDGVADRCQWTILDQRAALVRSAVFGPRGLLLTQAVGAGSHTWDGTDLLGVPQPDGNDYLLRVVLTSAGGISGHTLVFEEQLTLDRRK